MIEVQARFDKIRNHIKERLAQIEAAEKKEKARLAEIEAKKAAERAERGEVSSDQEEQEGADDAPLADAA